MHNGLPSGASLAAYSGCPAKEAVKCVSCLCMCQCVSLFIFLIVFRTVCSVGSPFHVNVIDPSKATARGDGLDMVQCNQPTSFYLCAPAAQLKDFDIKIIGKLNNIDKDSNSSITFLMRSVGQWLNFLWTQGVGTTTAENLGGTTPDHTWGGC